MKKQDPPIKVKAFPKCINKKQARMVCLNQLCEVYAFFCTQCDDESCEFEHRHQDKQDRLIAIGFKQFIRRVLKQRKPTQELQAACNDYKKTLEILRKDVNEFVDKEIKSLQQILQKAAEVPEDIYPTIKKLRQQNYTGLVGRQMDHLWRNCGESQDMVKLQLQTAEFIKIKNEELKAISQHFQNLNSIQIQPQKNIPKQKIALKPKK